MARLKAAKTTTATATAAAAAQELMITVKQYLAEETSRKELRGALIKAQRASWMPVRECVRYA